MSIDADLLEHTFHTKGTRLIGHDRNDVLTDFFVFNQLGKQTYDTLGRRNWLLVAVAIDHLPVLIKRRHFHCWMLCRTRRHRTAECFATFFDVLNLSRIFRRLVVRRVVNFFIGNWNSKSSSELHQVIIFHGLGIVSDHLAFACSPQPVTFHGFGQDHRWLPFVKLGCSVSRINLFRIVATATHTL